MKGTRGAEHGEAAPGASSADDLGKMASVGEYGRIRKDKGKKGG